MKNSYNLVSNYEKPPETFMHSLLDSIANLKKLCVSEYIRVYGRLEKQTVVKANGTVLKKYFIEDTDECVCMFVHRNNEIHFYERTKNRP